MHLFNFIVLFLTKKFSIWDPWADIMFSSVGAVFKIGLINIVASLFTVANAGYNVFITLAKMTNIFNKSIFMGITDRVYAIFGVVVLFIAAYNFLMYTIDPEKNSGDMSIEKMLKNIVKVFIIIILLPTLFSFANGIVGSIVEQGTIDTLIFGGDDRELDCKDIYAKLGVSEEKAKKNQNRMVDSIAEIFGFFFIDDKETSQSSMTFAGDGQLYFPATSCWLSGSNCSIHDGVRAAKCTGNFWYLKIFGINWGKGENNFRFEFFLSLFAAGYMIYVLVSFCFDLGVRAIKLAFYQVIAPLCVGCAILPGPKKEIYTKWRSLTIKTYTSVFVRILALDLGVLFIANLTNALKNINFGNCDSFCQLLVRLFLMLGILTFAKQVPKVIEELIGEETGLGTTVKDKLKEAAEGAKMLAAPAFGAGAAASSLRKGWNRGRQKRREELQNAKDAIENAKTEEEKKKAQDAYNRLKKDKGSLLKSLASGAATSVGALGRSVARTTGLSDAAGVLSQAFREAQLNTAGSVDAAGAFTNKMGKKGSDFKEWMDKRKKYKDKGGDEALHDKEQELEKANAAAKEMEEQRISVEIKDKMKNVDTNINAFKGLTKDYNDKKANLENKLAERENREAELKRELYSMDSYYNSKKEHTVDETNAYLNKRAALENSITAEHSMVQAAQEDLNNHVDMYGKQNEFHEKRLADYQKQKEELEKQIDKVKDDIRVELKIDGLEKEVATLQGLKSEAHDANVIANMVRELHQKASGTGAAGLAQAQQMKSVLDECSKGFLNQFSKISTKFGDNFKAVCDSNGHNLAAEKIFNNDGVKNIIDQLCNKVSSNTKDMKITLEGLSNQNLTNDEFLGKLADAGVSLPSGANVSNVRDSLSGNLQAFFEEENKQESYVYMNELDEFVRTGTIPDNCHFEGIFKNFADKPDFKASISAMTEQIAAFKAYSPSSVSLDPGDLSKSMRDTFDALDKNISSTTSKHPELSGAKKINEIRSGSSDSKK